jgi:LysR family glycine cleavage system transcriptional activator
MSPSVPRLPPVHAVRVFDAVARLGGFTRAGQALGMTQAAVSYQIRQLEDRLGFPLFVREPRGVSLTAAGARLASPVGEAFTLLERAFAQARRDGVLVISALPTFCSNWLVPRIAEFQRRHPALSVRIDARTELVDIRAGEADMAIRYGAGGWAGLTEHFLFPATLSALVPPATVARHGPFERPEDLLRLRLFGPPDWWRRWFAAAGCPDAPVPERAALELETQTMEVAAAIGAGDAAVMVAPVYFGAELASGTLVRPFDVEISDGRAYWLVYDKDRADAPEIRAFADWLLFDPAAFCLNRPAEPFQRTV